MCSTDLRDRRWIIGGAICIDKDKVWISVMEFNALYCYDLKTRLSNYIGAFPGEKNSVWKMHGSSLLVENKIFFLPDRSRFIHIVDTETGNIQKLEVHSKERFSCNHAWFYKGVLYFISEDSGLELYSFHIKTNFIEKHLIQEENNDSICIDHVVIGEKIYFACMNRDSVICYDFVNYQMVEYNIKADESGFGTISYDGTNFYLTGKKHIVQWNPEKLKINLYQTYPKGLGMVLWLNGQIVRIEGFTDQYLKNEKPFSFSLIIDEKLWLFPFRTNMVLSFDIKTGKILSYSLQEEEEDEISLGLKNRLAFCHYLKNSNQEPLIFSSTRSKSFYIIEKGNKGIQFTKHQFWADEPENLSKYIYGIDIEGFGENVEDFIEKMDYDAEMEQRESGIIGLNIYKKICS